MDTAYRQLLQNLIRNRAHKRVFTYDMLATALGSRWAKLFADSARKKILASYPEYADCESLWSPEIPNNAELCSDIFDINARRAGRRFAIRWICREKMFDSYYDRRP